MDWAWALGAMTVGAIAPKIEEHEPELVLIDGAYLLQDEDGGKRMWEKSMHISRGIKQIAQDYEVPVIITIQLNRQGDSRKNGDPSLSDVAYSDAYAQDVDFLLGLDQDDDQKLNGELKILPLAVREAPPVPII